MLTRPLSIREYWGRFEGLWGSFLGPWVVVVSLGLEKPLPLLLLLLLLLLMIFFTSKILTELFSVPVDCAAPTPADTRGDGGIPAVETEGEGDKVSLEDRAEVCVCPCVLLTVPVFFSCCSSSALSS
jgi:hypothetical protein